MMLYSINYYPWGVQTKRRVRLNVATFVKVAVSKGPGMAIMNSEL
jgi:hypothetical protein